MGVVAGRKLNNPRGLHRKYTLPNTLAAWLCLRGRGKGLMGGGVVGGRERVEGEGGDI